jgi:hypothetical protein
MVNRKFQIANKKIGVSKGIVTINPLESVSSFSPASPRVRRLFFFSPEPKAEVMLAPARSRQPGMAPHPRTARRKSHIIGPAQRSGVNVFLIDCPLTG